MSINWSFINFIFSLLKIFKYTIQSKLFMIFYDKEHLALQFLKLDHFLEIIKGKKWWHYFDHQRSFAFYRPLYLR